MIPEMLPASDCESRTFEVLAIEVASTELMAPTMLAFFCCPYPTTTTSFSLGGDGHSLDVDLQPSSDNLLLRRSR